MEGARATEVADSAHFLVVPQIGRLENVLLAEILALENVEIGSGIHP
jgi:hypothetical protein